MGVGSAMTDKKHMEDAVDGDGRDHRPEAAGHARRRKSDRQLPAPRRAWTIGCKVTLRGRRMYEFLDRLISLALPRVRDFRGLNRNAFDGHGNYSLGLTEQLVFPGAESGQVHAAAGYEHHVRDARRDSERRVARAAAQLGHAVPDDEKVEQEAAASKSTSFLNAVRSGENAGHSWPVNPKLPRRSASRSFQHAASSRRCKLCGRPRAVYRKFGLCRICFRKLADQGLIPGVSKASW